MRTSFSIVIAAVLLVPSFSLAQKSQWQIGGHAVAGFPQGEFRDVAPDALWGGLGYFTRRVGETPYRWGVEVGAQVLDSSSVELGRANRFFVREALVSSDMMFGHFLGRVQPVFGRVSPYVEGAVGVRAFQNSITFLGCVGCTVPTSRSHVTFSAGGGGGLAVRLKEEENEAGISLETRVRYLFGGSTEYFSESERPEELPEFPRESRTDQWMLTFGIVFDF